MPSSKRRQTIVKICQDFSNIFPFSSVLVNVLQRLDAPLENDMLSLCWIRRNSKIRRRFPLTYSCKYLRSLAAVRLFASRILTKVNDCIRNGEQFSQLPSIRFCACLTRKWRHVGNYNERNGTNIRYFLVVKSSPAENVAKDKMNE